MKGYKTLLILFVIAFIFSGCQDKEAVVKVPQDTSKEMAAQATENAAKDGFVYECDEDIVYTNEQLEAIIAYEGTKTDFLELYPTPYMAEYADFSQLVYYSDTSVADIHFGRDGERKKYWFELANISVPKNNFSVIKIGDSLFDVIEIDPKGDYNVTSLYGSGSAQLSKHFTSDRYMIWIYYDQSNLINKVYIESLRGDKQHGGQFA